MYAKYVKVTSRCKSIHASQGRKGLLGLPCITEHPEKHLFKACFTVNCGSFVSGPSVIGHVLNPCHTITSVLPSS